MPKLTMNSRLNRIYIQIIATCVFCHRGIMYRMQTLSFNISHLKQYAPYTATYCRSLRSLRNVCSCVLYVSLLMKHIAVVNKEALFYIQSVLGWCVCVCLINYDCYFGHCLSSNILKLHYFRKWFSLLLQVTEEVHKTKSTQFTIPVKESVTHCCQDILFNS
jgi:hypothetical protein